MTHRRDDGGREDPSRDLRARRGGSRSRRADTGPVDDGEDVYQSLGARRGGARSGSAAPSLAPGATSAEHSTQPPLANRGRATRGGSYHHAQQTRTVAHLPFSEESNEPSSAPSARNYAPGEPETRSAQSGSVALQTLTQPTARDSLHPNWFIRCIIYMAAFLHTKHHVTFRACALILVCLAFIFSSVAGNLVGTVGMPRTLKTVFAKLDIKQ
ncbi:hypothetical protein B0H14DRAFT_2859969 [Mycena olivaceomarginata]|nr:hypothetical protein B0H14DRAFT_2859969 [Mycena olivaceomarginata]